jgi:multidrug transporter EmrE-like cation transporter
MEMRDAILLLHPAIAVIIVFPLIGIVVNRALQTRQRRLQTLKEGKSKIPPVVGSEHVQLGRWLTGTVVGIVLIALANDVFGNIIDKQIWSQDPFKVLLIAMVFAATIASLVLLYQAKQPLWRGVFAILTGVGLIALGSQDGVYRNTEHWYISHYYYGLVAALLMIISLAIVREIYQDKANRWRQVHIALNCIALLMFIAQGISGTRSLLEVPLHWQEPYVNQLYEQQCETKPCTIQPSALPQNHQ